MLFPRSLPIFLVLACLPAAVFAAPATGTQAPAVLPQAFAGWQMQGTAQTSTSPAAADATNANVLSEYRFSDLASATYTRDDGRTLKFAVPGAWPPGVFACRVTVEGGGTSDPVLLNAPDPWWVQGDEGEVYTSPADLP